MPIREIIVHNHRVAYGQNSDEHRKWTSKIEEIIGETIGSIADVNKIEVFNLGGQYHRHNAGHEQRSIIFANANREGASREASTKQFITNEIAYETVVFEPQGEGLVITSTDGVPLAEYFSDYNELNILFDVFKEYNPGNTLIFKYIMNQWAETYWKRIELENSWLHTSNKNDLTKRFEERLKRSLESTIEENKRQAQSYERNIDDMKRKIKQYYDNMIRLRNQVEMEESNLTDVNAKLIKDLDLIVAHPKVDDLHIKNGKFIVFIPEVYCYDDHNRRFYIGNFRVEIKMENADVKFFGDNPKRSYWTSNDPHPHVNGRDGSACLGNVSSTIAELCSRNEIYALVLTCIDFLESANTSDPAGRNVTNWQRVDEEGKPISEPREEISGDTWTCDHCEEEQSENEEINYAYGYINDDGEPREERRICTACLEEDYHYDYDVEEWIES